MVVGLTDSAITRAARESGGDGKRRELADAGCRGLRLRITSSGLKTWVLACRDREGRMRRFTLGRHPGMGLREARDEARSVHHRVKQDGADPAAERRRERAQGNAARAGEGTLAALLATYTDKVGSRQKSWAPGRKRVERVFRKLLSQSVATLSAADLQIAADGYPAAASGSFAVRTLRPVLVWAAQRGYVSETVARLRQPAPVTRRKRVLSRSELAKVLPALRASNRPHAACMRFLLLTLARREEACRAVWRDVDFDDRTWTIPETKNGEAHVVPLSRQAVEFLRALAREDAMPADWLFATGRKSPLGNWDRETKRIMVTSETSGWNRHDLRRTGATMLGEMGELPDIVEAALNHVSIRSPLAATYNRSRYRPQVASALQRLADALDAIESAGEAARTSSDRSIINGNVATSAA